MAVHLDFWVGAREEVDVAVEEDEGGLAVGFGAVDDGEDVGVGVGEVGVDGVV